MLLLLLAVSWVGDPSASGISLCSHLAHLLAAPQQRLRGWRPEEAKTSTWFSGLSTGHESRAAANRRFRRHLKLLGFSTSRLWKGVRRLRKQARRPRDYLPWVERQGMRPKNDGQNHFSPKAQCSSSYI